MADLEGKTIASTYKSLLNVSGSDNAVLPTGSVVAIADGTGVNSALSLGTDRATITLGSDSGDDFIVGGTKLVVRGNNGFVGIGTSSPDRLLQIESSGTATTAIVSIATPNDGASRLEFSDVTSPDLDGGKIEYRHVAHATTADRDKMMFQTADSVKMVIGSAGNVGIGTTSPASLLHLYDTDGGDPDLTIEHVGAADQGGGNIIFKQRESGGFINDGKSIGQILFQSYDNTDNAYRNSAKIMATATSTQANNELSANISFWVNNNSDELSASQAMTIQYDGKVGIGTTSPGTLLEVKESSTNAAGFINNNWDTSAGTGSRLLIHRGATSGDTWHGIQAQDQGDNSNNDLILQKFGGNVGIGTDSPSHTLTLASGDANSPTLTILNESANDQVGGNLFFRNSHTDGVIAAGQVLGDIVWQATNNADADAWQNAAAIKVVAGDEIGTVGETADSPGEIQFHTTPNTSESMSPRMVIKSDGKVGIGTSSPSARLHLYADGANSPNMYIENVNATDSTEGGNVIFRVKDSNSGEIINDNQIMGEVVWQGYNYDGTAYDTACKITGRIDGEASSASDASDMPGELAFSTASEGSGGPSERMCIRADGKVGIGTTEPGQDLDVAGIAQVNSINCDTKVDIANGTFTNTSVAGVSMLRCDTSSGHCYIKGLDGGVEGQMLYVVKTSSANTLVMYNNSTDAASGDKLLLAGCIADDNSDYITVPAGYGGFIFIYQGSYWRNVSHTGAVTA